MQDPRITAAALAARDGDRAAAAEFVALTQQQVWRLLAHLSDRQVAEDLAQETYERAFAALHRFRAESPARLWLFTIARRVAADHLRRRARRPAEAAPILDHDRPLGHTPAADPAESTVTRQAISGLGAERREAFVLTQLVGLSYLEAAQVAGCEIGTIRSRVARARADLVATLHPHRSEPARPRSADATGDDR